MRQIAIILLLLCLTFGPRFTFASDKDCADNYAGLVHDASAVADKAGAHSAFDDKNILLNSVRTWRNKMRDFMMSVNGNEYPVMALDDGTPIKAYTLARDKDELPAVLQQLDCNDIKSEIDELLTFVNRYQDDLKDIQLAAANNFAKREALEKFIKENPVTGSGVDIEIPTMEWDKDGNLAYGTPRKLYYGSMNKIKMDLKRAKKYVEDATRNPIGPFIMNTADKRSIEQAIALKKLETYWKEIRTVESRSGIADDLIPIRDKLKALYQDPMAEIFSPLLRPTSNAWARVRNLQFFSEFRVLIWKRIPQLDDKIEKSKVVELIRSMKEEDQRALFQRLGLNRVAQSANIIGRSGPITRVLAVAGAPPAAGYGGKWVWDMGKAFFQGKVDAQECARTEDDDQYATCLQKYVEQEFPGTQLKHYLNGDGIIKLEDNSFTDPRVTKAIEKIQDERFAYIEQNRRAREMNGFFQAMASAQNPNSEKYQKKLVAVKDEGEFRKRLVHFLNLMYPVAAPEGKKRIAAILATGYDSDSFKDKLEDLKKISPDLAQMTYRMLALHDVFLHPDHQLPDDANAPDESSGANTTSASATDTDTDTSTDTDTN